MRDLAQKLAESFGTHPETAMKLHGTESRLRALCDDTILIYHKHPEVINHDC